MIAIFAAALVLAPQQQVHREATEWTNVWIPNAHKTDKPRVLLVGDSIAQAYYGGVQSSIKDLAYTARITTSRSVCDPLFERELEIVLDQYKFKAVHFNNGLHGTPYTDSEYGAAIESLVKFLKAKCPDAELIWADSTPLRRTGARADLNALVNSRNQLAAKIMKKEGIQVNSLHSLMADHDDLHSDDYHWKAPAIKLQAEQTAKLIREAFQKEPISERIIAPANSIDSAAE